MSNEQHDDIVWESPDMARSGHGRPSRMSGIVEQLRARPGEWARVTAVHPKSGTRLAREFPGTEWIARDVRTGDPKLYGRWVG